MEEIIHFQMREDDPNSKHVVEFTHLFYATVGYAKLS